MKHGTLRSSLSLSNLSLTAKHSLEKSLSNLNEEDFSSSQIYLKNVIKKTKTLPLTNSSKCVKSSKKFLKSCKSVDDSIECTETKIKFRKKLSQSLKNLSISSPNFNNTNNNRLSLPETQTVIDIENNDMNITENYVAQILSDPGVGSFRSMNELRTMYYSDR